MKEPAREGLANWLRQGDRQSQLMLLRHFIDRMPVLQNWPERAEGLPIGLVDDQPVYLPLEGHSLTIGSSGEGKFSSVIAPLALHDVLDANGVAAGIGAFPAPFPIAAHHQGATVERGLRARAVAARRSLPPPCSVQQRPCGRA